MATFEVKESSVTDRATSTSIDMGNDKEVAGQLVSSEWTDAVKKGANVAIAVEMSTDDGRTWTRMARFTWPVGAVTRDGKPPTFAYAHAKLAKAQTRVVIEPSVDLRIGCAGATAVGKVA